MLKRFDATRLARGATPQHGMSMLLVLIILMVMTLAAVGLGRSTLTANTIAGNLGMQRAATSSADQGMEVAIAWLESNSGQAGSTSATACASGSTVLACDQPSRGYLASRQDPASGQSWPAWWDDLARSATPGALGTDGAGNGVAYLIQRMCSSQGDASAGACSASPTSGTCGSSQTIGGNGGAGNLSCKSQVYYRITVKVSGPRNTVSYAQAMVAL
jgi:type IV pilus assembly protein PilX